MTKPIRKINNQKKFIIFFFIGIVGFLLVFYLALKLGSSTYSFKDIIEGIFQYNDKTTRGNAYFVHNIRLPRVIADFVVGSSLAVAGLIMQGTTKNAMADSGIMGISQGSTLGVLFIMAGIIPVSNSFDIYARMIMSGIGAMLVTSLIYMIAFIGKGRITTDRMVLSGMAISTLLSSITSAIILKNNLSSEMLRYTAGLLSETKWEEVRIAIPVFLVGIGIALLISRQLTVMNLGEDVSKGLGANTKLIRILSTVVVLVLSAVAVVIIGPVAYIGLMIPYIARYMVGTDYRLSLPITMLYGGLFVMIVDLFAKTVIPGKEFPITILITIIGVPFFIYTARMQKGDQFND